MNAVDMASLRQLHDDLGSDPDVMRELLDTFLRDAPKLVASMRASAANGDRRELNRAAHTLKSTAATFGAKELSQLCRELERDSEKAMPEGAAARAESVAREWARVEQDLRGWKP